MTARILDGKSIAMMLEEALAKQSAVLEKRAGRKPGLFVVLVGDDPASAVYVRNKTRACARTGVNCFESILPASTSQDELLGIIDEANAREDVDGILVQLPLPAHICAEAVIDRIAPEKDVDGFHMLSAGALLTGQRTLGFRPCTPMGVMKLIEEAGVDPAGKNVLVIGRSNIVGKPLAIMLLEKHATVTIAHSRTTDLKTLARNADIIVAAAGRIGLVTGDMIKPGALVIDVGTNRKPDGKLTGDVDFAAALEVAAAVTPVPGGVGPMTIAMLMKNTVESAERRLAQLP